MTTRFLVTPQRPSIDLPEKGFCRTRFIRGFLPVLLGLALMSYAAQAQSGQFNSRGQIKYPLYNPWKNGAPAQSAQPSQEQYYEYEHPAKDNVQTGYFTPSLWNVPPPNYQPAPGCNMFGSCWVTN